LRPRGSITGATELVIEPETLAKDTDLWGLDLVINIGRVEDMLEELDGVPCRWSLPQILSDYGREGRQADTTQLVYAMRNANWLFGYNMFKDSIATGEYARGELHDAIACGDIDQRAYLNLSGMCGKHPCYTPADAAKLDGRYLYMPAGEALQLAEAWPR